MGCGNVAWYAYAGQQLHTYFEKEEIAAKLFRKYPALLKSSADLHQAIMQEQLAPHRAQETEWERQMLRTEVKHYIDTSGLAYSYNEFYTQNMPDKVAWKTLQSDLFANLPQIKAERIIFSAISSSPPAVDTGASVVTAVWTYVGELAFNLLVLVGAIKGCDRIVKEIMGL